MCEDKSTTPVEIAANEESGELLMRKEYEEKAKEQFRGLLSSLPKDSVSGDKIARSLISIQVNTRDVRGYGTILQEAVFFEGKQAFVRILLDFGFDILTLIFPILVLLQG